MPIDEFLQKYTDLEHERHERRGPPMKIKNDDSKPQSLATSKANSVKSNSPPGRSRSPSTGSPLRVEQADVSLTTYKSSKNNFSPVKRA